MSTTLVNDVDTTTTPLAADAMVPRVAIVDEVRRETHDVRTYTLREQASPRRFLPGQFNMLYLPSFGEVAISISSDATQEGTYAHTIRAAGSVTRAIATLGRGAALGIRGPYGSAWPIASAAGRDLLLVAGGIGLAPLRPVIYHVLHHRSEFRNVTLLVGARTPADLLFTSELPQWQNLGIDVHVTVDRADDKWKGSVGVVPLLFYRLRLEPRETTVFTCGPEVMMHFVTYEALARRVPKEAIWLSLERNMKCAIGLCGHCQYGPIFVCRDGPVLNFARIERFFNREEF
ncbi:MAG: FAD/NAD(P)-binding protein [Thermoanaerobaculia bacterium]